MIPICSFPNPRSVCVALSKVANQKIGKFVKISERPYNYREPESTDWWLVPATDWPAYKYGKFFFDWGSSDSLLIGLYIEKGLDPEVSVAYPSTKGQRFIMQSDWMWHQFLRDCRTERVESLVKFIAQELTFPVEFRIDGGFVDDPSFFDPYTMLKSDKFLLHWNKEQNAFNLVESRIEAKLLIELANVKTFDDLSKFLEKMNDNKWLWLDVFIAMRLRNKNLESIPENERELWNEQMIWDRWLNHFLPWFR
ncbi:MAG: hypothetical protein ABIL02_05930 [candidate division WOR-3 bacterium]